MDFQLFSSASQPLYYLDPGSGSMIVQLVIGALFGIGVTLKLFWSKISSFFGGEKSVVSQSGDEDDDR